MKLKISSPNFWNDVNEAFGTGGGFYSLSCLKSDDAEESVPLPRLLGEDLGGTLYIGMAASFLDRVIELKKSLSPAHTSRAHECGARHKDHARILERFPYERLVVTLVASDNPRSVEQAALQRYLEAFGELPPLNRAG